MALVLNYFLIYDDDSGVSVPLNAPIGSKGVVIVNDVFGEFGVVGWLDILLSGWGGEIIFVNYYVYKLNYCYSFLSFTINHKNLYIKIQYILSYLNQIKDIYSNRILNSYISKISYFFIQFYWLYFEFIISNDFECLMLHNLIPKQSIMIKLIPSKVPRVTIAIINSILYSLSYFTCISLYHSTSLW